MIISEKQIMQLMHIAGEYRSILLARSTMTTFTAGGKQSMEDISRIIENIINQQSEELKEIE